MSADVRPSRGARRCVGPTALQAPPDPPRRPKSATRPRLRGGGGWECKAFCLRGVLFGLAALLPCVALELACIGWLVKGRLSRGLLSRVSVKESWRSGEENSAHSTCLALPSPLSLTGEDREPAPSGKGRVRRCLEAEGRRTAAPCLCRSKGRRKTRSLPPTLSPPSTTEVGYSSSPAGGRGWECKACCFRGVLFGLAALLRS